MSENGLKVIFADAAPDNAEDCFETVPCSELAEKLMLDGMTDVMTESGFPKLRIYHAKRGENDMFIFFNEDACKTADTTVILPCSGEYTIPDLFGNVAVSGKTQDGSFRLSLIPGESEIVVFGQTDEKFNSRVEITSEKKITPHFSLSLASYNDLERFEKIGEFDEFFNVTSESKNPIFLAK